MAISQEFTPQGGTSNYTKLTQGKHRLRVLGNALEGYSWWEETEEGGRKPNRIPMTGRPPVEYAEETRKFMAFPVFNYELGRIQIWEVTQSSIQKELIALEKDKDWGDLCNYDIEVERTGTDKNTTKYRVTPKPSQKLSEAVTKVVEENGLPVLTALYKGKDPFTYVENGEDSNEGLTDEEIEKLPF